VNKRTLSEAPEDCVDGIEFSVLINRPSLLFLFVWKLSLQRRNLLHVI